MKKIRSYLAVIALVATLSGPFFFQASGALASAATHRAGSPVAAGQSARSVAFIRPLGPCPVAGELDC